MSWNNSSLSLTKLDPIQNHDDFQIIWFGSDNYISEVLYNMIEILHQCFTYEECENYMKSVKTNRIIFFVMTDFFDCEFDLDRYDQIHSIYILNKKRQNINDKIRNSPRFTQSFQDESILIKRLRYDIVFTYRNDLPTSFSSINNMNNDQSLIKIDGNTLFYWNHFFIQYLINDQNIDMEQLREEMIKQCRKEYEGDDKELPKIDDFRNNCTLNNVLQWYTKDSFVYRLVNKALRTRNIDFICKFRYFIILLYKKLAQLSNQQQERNGTILYRGQAIKENELKILQSNVGHLISFNTLLSTTRNLGLAQAYASDLIHGIIFEIHVMNKETNNSLYPFADISEFSHFGAGEEEILFFLGATFRIDSIKKQHNQPHVIKLTFTNENAPLMQSLNNCLDRFTRDLPPLCDLYPIALDGYLFKQYYHYLTHKSLPPKEAFSLVANVLQNYLFNDSYDRRRSIDYYKQLLLDKTLINDESKTIVLHVILGNNYFQNSEYDKAFLHYDQACALIHDDILLTAEIFHRRGDVWTALGSYDHAMSCFKRAFDLFSSDNDKDEKLIEICEKIMKICPKEKYNQYAEKYETKAKEIIDHHQNHCKYNDKRTSLRMQQQFNINWNPNKLHDASKLLIEVKASLKGNSISISEVFTKFKQAKDMFKECYSMFDRFGYILCASYEMEAGAHLVSNDILPALIAWKKAIDIRMSLLLEPE